jgi:hypothetical protein
MARIEKHDARAWRARAEECRAIADTFTSAETRAKMYLVADDYDRMAEDAERAKEAADGAKGSGKTATTSRVESGPG